MSYSTITCDQCQQNFNKMKSEIKKSKTGKHFCSRSCSAKFNNSIKPKRKQQGKCKTCSCVIHSNRKYCDICLQEYYDSLKIGNKCSNCNKRCKGKKCRSCYCGNKPKRVKINKSTTDITLKESIYKNHHRSSAFAKVRTRARSIAKKLGWNSCSICGYDKHVEIDHIKPISEFDDSTKLSVINDPSNLRPLCPNCHWEVENL